MANIVNFTDKQFENRLNDNLEELVQGKKAVESPTAFLLGGQPGSGKTSLRSAILEETQNSEGKETLVKGIKTKDRKSYNAVVKIGEKGYIDFISFSK